MCILDGVMRQWVKERDVIRNTVDPELLIISV